MELRTELWKWIRKGDFQQACRDCGCLHDLCVGALLSACNAITQASPDATISVFRAHFAHMDNTETDKWWGHIGLDLLYGSSLVEFEHWSGVKDDICFCPGWVVRTLWNAPWYWVDENLADVAQNIVTLDIIERIQPELRLIRLSEREGAGEWCRRFQLHIQKAAEERNAPTKLSRRARTRR